MLGIPKYEVGMEISGGVEPVMEWLLAAVISLAKHIRLKDVATTAGVSEKLKVYLVVSRPLRRQLQICKTCYQHEQMKMTLNNL